MKWAILSLVLFLSFIGSRLQAQDSLYTDMQLALSNPTAVKILKLRGKQLENIPPLEVFNNLEELDLSKNYIDSVDFSQLNNRKLKHINLSQNHIMDLGTSIAELKQVLELELWSNPIQEFPKEIAELKQLKILNIRDIYIDKDQKKKLKKWLPDTKLKWSNKCECGLKI